MITLSKRLQALEDWIETDVLADIGCDHGYLCIKAVQDQKAKKAYACDIAEGPLQSARANISQNHLEKRIETRLQNGMESLPKDVTMAVMAGMGGLNMVEILEGAPYPVQRLLLSPHKDAPALRRYLYRNGWKIEKEKIVEEDGHFYPIMQAEFSDDTLNHMPEEWQLLWGVNLQDDEDARAFLVKRLNFWKSLTKKMPEGKRSEALNNVRTLEQAGDFLNSHQAS